MELIEYLKVMNYNNTINHLNPKMLLRILVNSGIDVDPALKHHQIRSCFRENIENITPEAIEAEDAFGLSITDVATILDCNIEFVTKLTDEGKLTVKFRHKTNSKVIILFFDISDVDALDIADLKKRVRIHWSKVHEPDDETYAEALSIINDKAKHYRNLKNNYNQTGEKDKAEKAEKKLKELYDLKSKTMQRLIDEGKMHFVGYELQVMRHSSIVLSCYEFCGINFHRICQYKVSAPYHKMIRGLIHPTKRTTKPTINYYEAIYILNQYITTANNCFIRKEKRRRS